MLSPIALDRRFFPVALQAEADARLPAAVTALKDLRHGRCRGGEFVGWYAYPERTGFALLKEIKETVQGLTIPYDVVVVIGIGGSYLGTRAVASALSHSYQGLVDESVAGRHKMIVYAGHNMSERGLVELLDFLATRQVVVNVISKSGTTTEPSVAFRVIRRFMETKYGVEGARRRIIATTDKAKGALRQLATQEGYKTFVVPDDIGGRYSVLSAVGLVPLTLAGYATDSLLTGAQAVFNHIHAQKDDELAQHPIVRYAAARDAAYRAGKKIDLLSYSEPKLAYLVEWWKQLFGESEGKEGKGLFPAGLAYTTDLHSLGQYVQEGERDLLETFLTFDDLFTNEGEAVERRLRLPRADNNLDELGYLENRFVEEVNEAAVTATKVAHYDGGVPCLELRTRRLDAFHLGALFAFFETACAVGGALLDVNPFDQPGVEAYKKNLFALLGKPGYEALGSELRKRLL